MSKRKKIVVIGGGVAGMAAGIYAQKNGFDSVIIEKHTISGGICTAWYRKGYKFDYCVQWLVGTKSGAFHDTMVETGILDEGVEVLDQEIHNMNLSKDGEEFVIYTDLMKWFQYLLKISPKDFRAIKKLCSDIRWASHLTPFDKAPALRNTFDYIKAFFVNFPSLYVLMRHRSKTYTEYIESLGIKSPELKNRLLGVYGEKNFASYAFLLIMGWYFRKNAGYPMGGSLGVAQRMQKKYESLGGEFMFKREVSEIVVEKGRTRGVKLTDGTFIEADYVVSAADGYSTLNKMLGGKFQSDSIKKAYQEWSLFASFVQVSFGVNKKLCTDYPVQVVLAQGEKIGSTELSHSYRILNYTFDPSMAPEGKSTIVFRFDSPYEWWNSLSKEEYAKEKERILEDTKKLLEKHYPGSAETVEIGDVATPLTTVRYTGVWKGAYEGFLSTPKNIINQLDQKLKGLEGFYLAGQWLFPGGGIPPSVHSGKWAIQLICRDEKKKFVS
jgi:phytoene dehydrogenase-like protein